MNKRLAFSRLPLFAWTCRGRSVARFGSKDCVYRTAAEALKDERRLQTILSADGTRELALCSLEATRTLLKIGPDGRIDLHRK